MDGWIAKSCKHFEFFAMHCPTAFLQQIVTSLNEPYGGVNSSDMFTGKISFKMLLHNQSYIFI